MHVDSSDPAQGGRTALCPRARSFQPLSTAISAIHDLWRGKRASARLPARSAFDFAELRPYFGYIAVLDVIDGGADFRFRLYGSQIVDAYRGEMTGRSVSDFKPAFRDAIVPGYRRCLATREPHYDVLDVEEDLVRFRWERIVLPLARDGETVDQLMVFSPGPIRGED